MTLSSISRADPDSFIATTEPERRYALARLGSAGPLLGQWTVQGINFWSGANGNTEFQKTVMYDDGSYEVDLNSVISPRAPEVTMRCIISAAGVTFEDGSHTIFIDGNEFDELGQYRLIMYSNGNPATCHYKSLWQDGVVIAAW